jgi:predicted HNH restriction endonuclease
MWTSELGLAAVIGGWILYELYGRRFLENWASYIRLATGGLTIVGLWWYARQSPENFTDTIDLAKQLLVDGSGVKGSVVGTTREKRNVTGLMKKKVAASQQWKCGNCKTTLDETYEVDHKLALFKGGTNDESNLVALCPHCHRKKTVEERLVN